MMEEVVEEVEEIYYYCVVIIQPKSYNIHLLIKT